MPFLQDNAEAIAKWLRPDERLNGAVEEARQAGCLRLVGELETVIDLRKSHGPHRGDHS